MTWIKLNHRCVMPEVADPDGDEVRSGSVWECDSAGCGKRWTLTLEYRDGRNGADVGYFARWAEVTE